MLVSPLMLKMWTLMFAGAFLCAAASVVLIWRITATGDASVEWLIWIFVFLGFGLFAGGYLAESKYRREHPEEYSAADLKQ